MISEFDHFSAWLMVSGPMLRQAHQAVPIVPAVQVYASYKWIITVDGLL